MKRTLPLALLLLAVGGLHALVYLGQPDPTLSGDENHYFALARQDAALGERSLLPGALRFEARPELFSRVLANLVPAGADERAAVRRASVLHIALLLALLGLTCAQARALGLGPVGSVAAAALLGFFPWFGFYVHALWPEILHAFLFGVALLGILVWFRRPRWWALALSGVFLGYALFAKGALDTFLPVAVVYVGFATARATPERSLLGRRWLAGVAAGGLLLVSTLAVIGPQLAANAAAGHGARLASNRWWNLELGLRGRVEGLRPPGDPGDWPAKRDITRRHRRAGEDWVEREQKARARTLRHLDTVGALPALGYQVQKLLHLILREGSVFEDSLAEKRLRWGEPPPAPALALRLPARIHWYALWLLGPAGLALTVRRGPGWRLLALFTGFYAAAVLAVPILVRMLMPLVPILCLFAGAAIEAGWGRWGRAPGRPTARA